MPSTSTATSAGSSGAREGDAFPQRTIDLLKNVDAALFGAITSKPAKAAEAELAPALQDKGLIYRSPIVRMRQLFDLYVCLRPCKAYPGNPLNFQEGIDLVVFRENTEDLYAGVEFAPVPHELADTLAELVQDLRALRELPGDEYAISCKINTRAGSERIAARRLRVRAKHGRKKVTVVHKANVVRATDGLFLEAAREVAKDYPDISGGRSQHRRHVHVAAQEPVELRCAGGAQPVRRHRLGPLRADGGRTGLRLLRQYRRRDWRCSSPPTAPRPSTRASIRSTRSPRSWPPR